MYKCITTAVLLWEEKLAFPFAANKLGAASVNQQLHEYLSDRRHQVKVAAIELPPVARDVAVSRSLKGHEKIVADFNAALAKASSDGSHKSIIQRWDQRYTGGGAK